MGFEIIFTRSANTHIDRILAYIMNKLMNPQAARAVAEDLDHAWDVLESMASSFHYCTDPYLAAKGYRKLALEKHDYVIIYKVEGNTVTVHGVFHMKENYRNKL